MTNGESGSPSLSDVEAVVRENVSGHVDGDRHEEGKQQLLAALRERRHPGPRTHQGWLLGAFVVSALLTAIGVAWAWTHRSATKLSYEITGGLVSESGYVRSAGASGARLTFTDGTRIDLQDGARARIVNATAQTPRIAVENGHACLNVARSESRPWLVDAGPFVIQVASTQFDVDWSSYDDTLSVDLHEGSLTVSGPPAPTGVLLRAGQRLTAHEGRLAIEALESAVQVAEPVLPELPLVPETADAAIPPTNGSAQPSPR